MFDTHELERRLGDARTALRDARAVAAAAGAREKTETEGEAADGRVRAVLGAHGRLTSITIDPRALRDGSDRLAADLVTAVNAALDAQDDTPDAGEPAPDLDALDATVERVQDEGLRQMRAITAAIDDVMRKLQRS